MVQNPGQANILQLLQGAVNNQNMQQMQPQSFPNAVAQPQSANQLSMLLSALGNNQNVGNAGLGGNAALLNSLAGQSNAIKPETTSTGFLAQGHSAATGAEAGNSSANQSAAYYDELYNNQSQSSYGPVRYASSQRSDTKPNAYRPY